MQVLSQFKIVFSKPIIYTISLTTSNIMYCSNMLSFISLAINYNGIFAVCVTPGLVLSIVFTNLFVTDKKALQVPHSSWLLTSSLSSDSEVWWNDQHSSTARFGRKSLLSVKNNFASVNIHTKCLTELNKLQSVTDTNLGSQKTSYGIQYIQ